MTTLADAIANPSAYSLTNGAKLDSILAAVDGLETLIGATNTALAAANASLDNIEANAVSAGASPVQTRNPDYETVAASATDQVMGTTGAANDYLSHLIITPATTSPGNVIIKDGSTTIFTFSGGASSVTTLIPFMVPLGLVAATAWKITTGANVSAVAVGDFS